MSTTPLPANPPRLREIALFCLPAVLLGLVLRVVLCASMPLAFISPDTNEFFFGTRLLGGSRTFLPKLIYGLPVSLHLPLLPSIALIQHALGLVTILAGGCLCVQWLQKWRWWIVPFTVLLAVQPTMLWYEHFALPDSMFLLAVLLACLAGGHFHRHPEARSFALLFITLFFVAGARQEGFLFLVFGLALVVRAYWGEWRRFRVFVPLALVLSALTAKMAQTNQGGFMLLTSLIHHAPDRLWSEPDLSPRVVELREGFKPQWPAYPDRHNRSRKTLLAEIDAYLLDDKGVREKELALRRDAVCKRLAIEIAVRNFWRLPGLAFNKFRAMHGEIPAPDFGAEWAHVKHLTLLFGKPNGAPSKERQLHRFYLGRDYASREDLEKDLPRLYRILPGDFLSHFQRRFYAVEYGGAIVPAQQVGIQMLPALPLLYLFTFAGFAWVFFRDGRAISDRQLWLLMLLFQAFVICLTGSLRSRYRLSFEPWFLLGAFCFLDSASVAVRRRFSPLPAQVPPASADRPSSDKDRT